MKKTLFIFSDKLNRLLLGILLANISTYMLNAFLTIFMSRQLGFSPARIGLVLTISLISQRGCTFFGGLLADIFGYKRIMVAGLLLRAFGYFSYLFAINFPLLILSSILIGFGGALKDPTLNAAIAFFADDMRLKAFTIKALIGNLCAALGPLIGTVLFTNSYQIIFVITGCSHLLFAFIVLRIPFKSLSQQSIIKENVAIQSIIKDKALVLFTLLTSGFWFLFTQLNLTIPLYISTVFGKEYLIGLVYSLDGFLAISLQFFILKRLKKRWSSWVILAMGSGVLGFAFIFLVANNVLMLFIFTIFFSVGVMCVIPLIDEIASNMAPDHLLASYLGFISFGWGIGGTLGNLLGGYLFEALLNRNHLDLLWYFFCLIGFTMMLVMAKWKNPNITTIKKSISSE